MGKKSKSPKVGYKYTSEQIDYLMVAREGGLTWVKIAEDFNKHFKTGSKKSPQTLRIALENHKDYDIKPKLAKPKVLILDIETAPLLGYIWSLWNNNLGLNQLKKDWCVLSWAAKWLGDSEDKVIYRDQRHKEDMEDDSDIMGELWHLLDECDILITQNGIKFDSKKVNSRFILHGFEPPSTYKQIDTLVIAKKNFAFTSNKLAYMTDKLCTKYKKLDHGKFAGMNLWTECLKGNMEAWDEMELYNRYDILSLEELYVKMAPWDRGINFNIYHDSLDITCKCGHGEFKKSGFHYTAASKFQKYKCKACGHETRDSINLHSKDKRKSLRRELR